MKPKKILLVRHGESEGNVNKEVYKHIPDYALRLTENGWQQALQAGKEIKNLIGEESVKFFVSPFWRTRQTYQGIAKSFPNIKKTSETFYEDLRLREQEWSGNLREDGFMHEAEAERDEYGHLYYRFERGESCADVFDRMSGFLDTLFREFEKPYFADNCVIVTHGMTLRVFLMRFFHLSVEQFESLRNPKNCQVVVLQLDEKTNKYKILTEMKKYEKSTHPYQYNWSNYE